VAKGKIETLNGNRNGDGKCCEAESESDRKVFQPSFVEGESERSPRQIFERSGADVTQSDREH